MRRLLIALAAASALPAAAQTPATPSAQHSGRIRALEGAPVIGKDGVVLGRVERATLGPDGRPAQLLVRPQGLRASGPRSLAFDAVRITEKGVETPLTRAEFQAMPAVETPAR